MTSEQKIIRAKVGLLELRTTAAGSAYGQKIEAPRERAPSNVVNLIDALRRSVETERAGGERRKPERRAAAAHQAP